MLLGPPGDSIECISELSYPKGEKAAGFIHHRIQGWGSWDHIHSLAPMGLPCGPPSTALKPEKASGQGVGAQQEAVEWGVLLG